MTDAPNAGAGAELRLRGQALELTLAALEAERARLTAKYDQRIAELRGTLQRIQATPRDAAEPAGEEHASRATPRAKRTPRGSARPGRSRAR
jgi:hypothetical protein